MTPIVWMIEHFRLNLTDLMKESKFAVSPRKVKCSNHRALPDLVERITLVYFRTLSPMSRSLSRKVLEKHQVGILLCSVGSKYC